MSRAAPQPPQSPAALGGVLHSFRFRLTLLFVAILALILAIFSIFIYTRQAQILRVEVLTRLAAQSDQLAEYYRAQMRSSEEESEDRSEHTPQGSPPLLPENALLVIVGLDKQVTLLQGALQPSDLAALIETWNKSPAALESVTFNVPGQGNAARKTYLFKVSFFAIEGGWGGYMLLGSPEDPGGQMPRLAVSLALSSLLILLFAFGGGYWLADRAMQPVQAIVRTARRIGESDLSQRLNLHRRDELGELADTFDQMLDRLQAAFERQRQFTADASHELRSPLAIIELEANRALERPRTLKEYEKALRLIQSENEWMGRLVNELLLLARMDAGQTAMQLDKLDLSEVVVDVTERLSALAQVNGVVLKTGALVECFVQADRIYLAQLINNLVENAIKYTHRQDALVQVETANQALDGQAWSLVSVSDNGQGIPEDQLPYIFNRFYRLDKARTRQPDEEQAWLSGSGLGLAIAKSIAQAYGGRIEVTSQAGEGATFTVWLPAA